MNIVFMGTPDFSVPTLEKLYSDKDINISYVVTKADAKSSRGQKMSFSDVKVKANELNLKVLQPEKLRTDTEVINKIKEASPDFIIVVAYGQILPKEVLDIPKIACINGHASLLPKYRGASPIQSALLNGDTITGTTSMLMDVGLDTGDILEQNIIEIDKKGTAESLFDKLSVLTAETLYHTIKNFDSIKSVKQDETKASKCSIISKENGLIDFARCSCDEVDRKVRAYNPWPSAYFMLDNEPCKLWDVDICENVSIDISILKEIAENVFVSKNEIYARCNNGYIRICELQKSGKKRMKAIDFINGLR